MAKSESLIEALQNVVTLSSMLDKYKPMKKEDEERLWKKFRLEWNYNSNHIEGNTLTYQQTELLLIFDKTTGDQDMREYEEMKAHDVAVEMTRKYANDKTRELTEADIREWNKLILVRPFWGNAITEDGQPTRKLIQPGEYKSEPNSVKLQNGEMFHYASPDETPAKMQELVAWYRKVEAEKTLNPVEIAAQLHYDFVRIHPFDDSNGRTSRLLMNYVLLKHGYPPVIIKASDKKGYLNALNKADTGDLEAFIEYIGKQLLWSLDLSLKAAQGESIDEHDDVEKEIAVWKKSMPTTAKRHPEKSGETVEGLFSKSLAPLFENFVEKQKQAFDDEFVENDVSVYAEHSGQRLPVDQSPKIYFEGVIRRYQEQKTLSVGFNNEWKITYEHSILRNDTPNNLHTKAEIKVSFLPLHYVVGIEGSDFRLKKFYSEFLSEEEVREIINKSLQHILSTIKRKTT